MRSTVWSFVAACSIVLSAGCGGGDPTEPSEPRPATQASGGEGESGAGAAEICAQAVRCCYAFTAALTEDRPEDRSTCIELEQFPTDGSGAADNCSEMIGGWQTALAEANRDSPECS